MSTIPTFRTIALSRFSLSCALLLGSAPTACIAAAPSQADDGKGANQDEEKDLTLLQICSGTFYCQAPRVPESEVVLNLSARGSDCLVDGIKVDFPESSIHGTKDKFRMCSVENGNDCLICERVSTGAREDESGCTGNADSCSTLSGTSCALQLGCQYTVGATPSTYDDGCSGSERECSEISSQESCELQSGCDWSGS